MILIFRVLQFSLALFFGVTPLAALSETRIALVVGNENYSSVSSLDNPANDARLIAETLEELGFEVTLLVDANQIELRHGISQFGRDLRDSERHSTGLFYYAGHGVQSFGANYLLPVDVSLTDAADLELAAIEAESILQQMFSAKNLTNIVILDACRNNPFDNIPAFDDNGLAEMKAPTGTFLAYATAPGEVALDGLGGNSPFSLALASEMVTPGVLIEQMFKKVRVSVLEQSDGRQTPWDASSLTSDFAFAAKEIESSKEVEELKLWSLAHSTRDPAQLKLFLLSYPESQFEQEAREVLAEVMGSELPEAASTAPIRTDPSAASSSFIQLSNVQNWMYQIQELNEDGAVEALAATEYDMLVVEPGHNFSEWNYNTSQIVSDLHRKPDGNSRLLLAYVDIGEAEDYRDYWKEDWIAPQENVSGYPDFLITTDPDGWAGNYPVAYWEKDWQSLWLGSDGIVAELAKFGFDGIYVDWIEAYDDDAVRDVAKMAGVSPETAMIAFIEKLGAAGRAINPDFLVVAQNAIYLIDTDPERYTKAIDALAVEDTWFHGLGDSDWDDPDGGDQRDRYDEEYSTTARLDQISRYQDAGLPVFSVDYALKKNNAAKVYDSALGRGLIPLVTRVALSKLTETPPPSLLSD